MPAADHRLVYLGRILLLASAYFVFGEASFQISVSHNIVTLVVFAAEGFALAFALRYGYRIWPGIFLGQLVLALYNDLPLLAALMISAINSMEAMIAVYLFRRFRLQQSLPRLRDLGGLILLIFLVCQTFSASLGVGTLWLTGILPADQLSTAWLYWWFGNSMGQLLITPLLLSAFNRQNFTHLHPVHMVSAACFALVTSGIFFSQYHHTGIALEFALFTPMLVLLAAWGGLFIATLCTAIIATNTLYATSVLLGPFVENGDPLLLDLNLFLIGTALSAQLVAVLFEERRQDKLALQRYIDREKQRSAGKQQKLEEQLRQAQKMEAVGRLAGGVAHDYNNMLSIIIGYTDLALHKVKDRDILYKYLSTILSAANRSADITRQLLTFARKQTIAPKVIDLNEHIEKAMSMLSRLIGEHIRIRLDLQADLWRLNIDPVQVDQILTNLCVNSRDAISDQGHINITTENVTLTDVDCDQFADCMPGDYVLLSHLDSGSGMDPQTLEHAFDPFYTTKDINEGTGLGLSMIYGIITQNGGFVHVDSHPGRGTRFDIYLPRFSGQIDTQSSGYHPTIMHRGQGETILLVEDEHSVLELAETVLQSLGYRVLATNHPLEAAELAREHEEDIHLLITDVIMPDLNGPELAKQVKTINSQIRVLYISGYTDDMLNTDQLAQDGAGFLQKPFDQQQLAAAVVDQLGRTTPSSYVQMR